MKKLIASLCCAASLSPVAALASNDMFMYNMPVAYFTTEDTQLFTHTVKQALDHSRDGSKLTWKNPKTQAHGYVTPSHTTMQKGQRCRMLEIYNSAQTVSNKSSYEFCRINNEWKIIK